PVADELDQKQEFAWDNFKAMSELGLTGMGIPIEYGGSGGDELSVRESSRKLTYFKNLADLVEKRNAPAWLERDAKTLAGKIGRLPERSEIDGILNEQLIVEYYSR
ncbi:MAG: acyl-CoA dehydrogenase family protein, partial [Anaerolineae bacterium]|nr:acyl-CoA dehydrogenase family protein [Anaerolineae bacterium]